MRTLEERNIIKQLHAQGKNKCQISRETGISRSTISDIIRDKHVKMVEKSCNVRKKLEVTKEKLQELSLESFSIAEILRKLGLQPAGGNYRTIKEKIKVFEINTSHFSGSKWNK